MRGCICIWSYLYNSNLAQLSNCFIVVCATSNNNLQQNINIYVCFKFPTLHCTQKLQLSMNLKSWPESNTKMYFHTTIYNSTNVHLHTNSYLNKQFLMLEQKACLFCLHAKKQHEGMQSGKLVCMQTRYCKQMYDATGKKVIHK